MNIEFEKVVTEYRNGYEVGRLRTAIYIQHLCFLRRLRGAGKQGIKSGGINQVIATAFVLRVLKENPDYINTISEFEEKIEAIDDDGNENKAFADIVESNSKIIECKSWEINGKAFQNFVLDSETPVGSVKQFTTYLMDDNQGNNYGQNRILV